MALVQSGNGAQSNLSKNFIIKTHLDMLYRFLSTNSNNSIAQANQKINALSRTFGGNPNFKEVLSVLAPIRDNLSNIVKIDIDTGSDILSKLRDIISNIK